MSALFQTISGRVTNPSTTITAVTMDTGDSNTLKTFQSGAAWLLNVWAKQHTLGVVRVRSSLLHDNAQAIRLRTPAIDKCRPLLPLDHRQPLQSADVLTIEQSGDASGTDVVTLMLYYENGPGGTDDYISSAELAARRIATVGVEVPITSGGTAGQYGGGVALNSGAAASGILKAGAPYAIVGILTDTELANVGISGPDWSNVRLGVPGSTDAFITRDWFDRISSEQDLPLIPVFNASNAGNITVDVIDTATASTINVTVICAQLSGPPPAPTAF